MNDVGGAIGVPPGWSVPVRKAAALRPLRLPAWLAAALALLGITLMSRWFLLGNPIVHIDEQFYLLVGEHMRLGAIPYVDIWDRKPVGLFLLYQALAALPGDPVIAYQTVAIAATVGTAMVIACLAREIASTAAAWQAGAAYALFMPAFNSGMGQAPTYYNLLVALAALGVVETVKHAESKALVGRGAAIMLLVGVAIQIKYTVIFEGIAFGLLLLGRGYADVWNWRKLFAAALLWIMAALAPTLAAAAWYAGIGQLDAFVYANFGSIFQRGSDGWQAPWRLTKEMTVLLPFWLAIFRAPRLFDTSGGTHPRSHPVLAIWGSAAFAGFLLFGTWYDHYTAPLLLPLAVLAAPALARNAPSQRFYGRFLLGLGALAGLVVPIYQLRQHGSTAQFEEMNALIAGELRGGCLYIYEGEMAFYRTLPTCLPTTRIFPNHLNTYLEAPAVGVDPVAEVNRIMANRPAVVVLRAPSEKPYLPNWDTRRVIKARLAQGYQRYATYKLGNKVYWLYRLRQPAEGVASASAS